MGAPTSLLAFTDRLSALLEEAEADLGPDRLDALRALVHERRNPRRGGPAQIPPADLARPADAIVDVLEEASRVLRPRETQQLDDRVAGKAPVEGQPAPRRARRRQHGPSRSL
jgi:hypothetical protein